MEYKCKKCGNLIFEKVENEFKNVNSKVLSLKNESLLESPRYDNEDYDVYKKIIATIKCNKCGNLDKLVL